MKLNINKRYIKWTTSVVVGLLSAFVLSKQVSAQSILYEVQPGDTVFGSAQAFGKSAAEVSALNGLNGNIIHPGQMLVIEGSPSELTEISQTLSPAGFIETVGVDQPVTLRKRMAYMPPL